MEGYDSVWVEMLGALQPLVASKLLERQSHALVVPVNPLWTQCFWIFRVVERTLGIGVRINAASQCQVVRKNLLALLEPLNRRQAEPFLTFVGELFVSHLRSNYRSGCFRQGTCRTAERKNHTF